MRVSSQASRVEHLESRDRDAARATGALTVAALVTALMGYGNFVPPAASIAGSTVFALAAVTLSVQKESRKTVLGAIVAVTIAAIVLHRGADLGTSSLSTVLCLAMLPAAVFGIAGSPLRLMTARTEKLLRLTLFIFISANLISALLGIRVFTPTSRQVVNYSAGNNSLRASALFPSPNELGASMAIVLIGTIIVAMHKPGRTPRVLIFASSASLATLFLSGTRGALIAAGAGILGAAIVRNRDSYSAKAKITILISALLALYVLAFGLTIAGRDLLGRGDDGSAAYRAQATSQLTLRIFDNLDSLGTSFVNGNSLAPSPVLGNIGNVDNSLYFSLIGFGFTLTLLLSALLIVSLGRLAVTGDPRFGLLLGFVGIARFENAIVWPGLLIVLIATILWVGEACRES